MTRIERIAFTQQRIYFYRRSSSKITCTALILTWSLRIVRIVEILSRGRLWWTKNFVNNAFCRKITVSIRKFLGVKMFLPPSLLVLYVVGGAGVIFVFGMNFYGWWLTWKTLKGRYWFTWVGFFKFNICISSRIILFNVFSLIKERGWNQVQNC